MGLTVECKNGHHSRLLVEDTSITDNDNEWNDVVCTLKPSQNTHHFLTWVLSIFSSKHSIGSFIGNQFPMKNLSM